MSWIVSLPSDRRDDALAAVRALVAERDGLVLRHRAEVYWARLA
jgi:hypothetical protein